MLTLVRGNTGVTLGRTAQRREVHRHREHVRFHRAHGDPTLPRGLLRCAVCGELVQHRSLALRQPMLAGFLMRRRWSGKHRRLIYDEAQKEDVVKALTQLASAPPRAGGGRRGGRGDANATPPPPPVKKQ